MKTVRRIACVWCLGVGGAMAAEEVPQGSVSLQAGTVAVGVLGASEEKASRAVVVDRSRSVRVLVTATEALRVVVELPDGSTLTPESEAYGVSWHAFVGDDSGLPGLGGKFNTLVVHDKPPAGRYFVHVIRVGGGSEVPFMITTLPDSDLRMGLWVQSPYVSNGRPFALAVVLQDGEAPAREATVAVTLSRPPANAAHPVKIVGESFLRDDGRDGDAREGDGVYSGVLVPAQSGTLWVTVRARGLTTAGEGYERVGGLPLQVSEPTVEVTPRGEPTWRVQGGLVDALLVDVSATGVAGAYDVTATVRAPNGRSVTGAASFQLTPSGGEAQVVVRARS